MTYPEAMAAIREGTEAECEAGLPGIDPLDHDALLDLVLELWARVTAAEKREAQRVASVIPGVLKEMGGLPGPGEQMPARPGDTPCEVIAEAAG